MHPITTHVLDTAKGKPASNISVCLEKKTDNGWTNVSTGITDSDGRVSAWGESFDLEQNTYRITFSTGEYFKATSEDTFYPEASISFNVKNTDQHYHVPLLLSNFGFATYRGS